ncbi:zinc ribbon domain-containing protein [Acidianus manzaensis]|uniref:Putative zinc-ribbon domain-containing protein n=1 Tax=Acidianus manzaensis TaxID=282676 RepID=A0A1W6JZF4_9CREN|nr:zinc ribbon domain-containing protein [Acidianus manzaensis]ARM75615.1 hypothetical protein B6F84_05900 [Acidianus manzaensis]
MKKCPICGTENQDDANSCSNCGYIFPSLEPFPSEQSNSASMPEGQPQSNGAPPEGSPTNVNNTSNKRKITLGILGIVIIALVAFGFLVLPSLLYHRPNNILGITEKYYGNEWYILNSDSGSEIIYSNNTARVSLLNGTSQIISYNSSGLAGTTLQITILNQKTTNYSIYILNVNFSNITVANEYFNYSTSSLKEEISSLNIPLNNMTFQQFSIFYITGGNITIDGTQYPIPGIAMAGYNNHFIEIESKGIILNQNFIKAIVSFLN